MNEIKLVQSLIIEHDLVRVGRSVTERLEALNIEGQVVTEDTIQTLKKLRAELNKESKEWTDQIKAVDEIASKPIKEFKEVAKTEIVEKYKAADEVLKNKIGEFENNLKAEKRENILSYFAELCINEDIDFLKFEQLGLEVNLSTTEKAYKEKCLDFVNKVVDDLALISTQEHQPQILTEYKKTLNASKAIKEIQDRKQSEKLEAERIYFAEQNRRKAILLAHAMTFNSMTSTHDYDEDIFISDLEVKELSKEEFSKSIVGIEEAIRSKKDKANSEKQLIETVTKITTTATTPGVIEPLKAPIVEVVEETFLAKFECTITRKQGAALKEFFINNNINYKNI